MQYRRLGKWGVQVSALSLGSWLTFGKQITDDVAEECMRMAYENGVNFFDSAEGYAEGEAERVMGRILKKTGWDRTSYLVSSKVFWGGKKPNQEGLCRKHIFEACHGALQRLQVEYLDFFFCHRPDPATPIEETVWAMNALLQQGKIFYWGTSEWSAEDILKAHIFAEAHNLIGPSMEQPQYNMFHRQRVEQEYKPLYEKYGMGTTIWSPLYSGILTGKYNTGLPQENTRITDPGLAWLKESNLREEKIEKVRKLTAIANETGASMTDLALAWCLKSPYVSTVITGASKPQHVKENMKAVELADNLTDDIMSRIETILG